MKYDILVEAKNTFQSEIDVLFQVKDSLGDVFLSIFDEIVHTTGKVILTGIGKPGHIATKAAATFSSLGVPSFYLHPAEAQHGDLGMIQKDDLVIAISYSGESTEITRILPNIKEIGARLVGITGNRQSTLAKNCDIVEVFPKFEEAGYLKLAPTSSTTATLVYFDALAIAISKYKNFDKKDFGLFHPAGALGKKLLMKVEDIMVTGEENANLPLGSSFKDAIIEMCKKPTGLLNVVDDENHLIGVISDGDIRRALLHGFSNDDLVDSIMTNTPLFTTTNVLAVDALSLMITKRIQCLPVLHKGLLVGTVQLKDILKEGISL